MAKKKGMADATNKRFQKLIQDLASGNISAARRDQAIEVVNLYREELRQAGHPIYNEIRAMRPEDIAAEIVEQKRTPDAVRAAVRRKSVEASSAKRVAQETREGVREVVDAPEKMEAYQKQKVAKAPRMRAQAAATGAALSRERMADAAARGYGAGAAKGTATSESRIRGQRAEDLSAERTRRAVGRVGPATHTKLTHKNKYVNAFFGAVGKNNDKALEGAVSSAYQRLMTPEAFKAWKDGGGLIPDAKKSIVGTLRGLDEELLRRSGEIDPKDLTKMRRVLHGSQLFQAVNPEVMGTGNIWSKEGEKLRSEFMRDKVDLDKKFGGMKTPSVKPPANTLGSKVRRGLRGTVGTPLGAGIAGMMAAGTASGLIDKRRQVAQLREQVGTQVKDPVQLLKDLQMEDLMKKREAMQAAEMERLAAMRQMQAQVPGQVTY